MASMVYLQNDPDQMLYYENSVPKGMKVIKPDSQKILEILEQKLILLGVTSFDWLYCAISWELPKKPIFYPSAQGITQLYEQSKLVEWFTKNPNVTSDPMGLHTDVKLADYVSPEPEQILNFVVNTTGLESDLFVADYASLFNSPNHSEADPLLDAPSTVNEEQSSSNTQNKSCFYLFLHSIFCCNRARRKEPLNEESSDLLSHSTK